MPLQPATRLGPYQIGEPLGAGGMGEVYRARDTRLDRSVAIKVIPSHLSSLPELRERFEREARTISSLNHPHICALYDIGSQDGVDYLVMEYLEGRTLADRLGESPRTGSGSALAPPRALKLEEALTIAHQIADALDKAHRQGVVHRDLKPGNIMLTASGAKLLDFGLAKQAQPAVAAGQSMMPTDAQPLTAQGSVLGTLQYMAPEQLEGREADARTDVFAFGAVLYEMVTGRRAFEAKSQVSLIAAIVDHDPPPVSSVTAVSPPLLDHLVKNCLAKNPDKRWQSMADVALQLRLIADSIGEAASGAITGRAARQLRLARFTAAALGALVIAGAAAAGVWWFTAERPAPLRLQFDVPTPLTFAINQIAASPRGTQVVATLATGGGSILWLGSLERGNGQNVPGTEGAAWPFWSRDGRFIGFFSGGKLKKVDLAGAPPQTLCDAVNGTGATWNQHDVIVFAPDVNGPLFRVGAAGGVPTPLTELDKDREEIAHRHPYFLPDGRHFIYVAVSRNPENAAIVVGSLDSAERTLLVRSTYRAAFAAPDRLLFMRENTLMAQQFDPAARQLTGDAYPVAENIGTFVGNSAAGFSTSDNGVLVYRGGAAASGNTSLRWLDRDGREASAVATGGDFANPALAPDLQRVAVTRMTAAAGQGRVGDLWILDLTRGTSTRFTFDPAHDDNPIWSPDGSSVVFNSNREGAVFNLYQKRATGIEQEELLLKSDHHKAPEDWSQDGTLLLYRELDAKTNDDLWVLPLSGDKKPQPVVRSPFSDGNGRFSPDGRWIAYVSNESGRSDVYVLGFPKAASRIQISTAGGIRPQWRGDGKELFFLEPADVLTMMAVDISVAADGSLKAGLPRKLFGARILGMYDLMPDGKRFLISVPGQETASTTPPLTVLVNWSRTTP